jgi:CubicO group peptidase (beta-lactamase class C family)
MIRAAYYVGTVCYVGCIGLVVGKIVHASYPAIAMMTLVISGYLLLANSAFGQPVHQPLPAMLESIRVKYKLPALAGAIFTTDGLKEMAAVGVRKQGDPTPVTENDLWHLGSDSKAMTATLVGTYVAEKKLSWDDKVISFFPDLANRVPESMRNITLAQVMTHQAGLIENLKWFALSRTGSLMEQRRTAVEQALMSPAYAPGVFHYANTDYVVIGAVLEKISGRPWEDLIRERLFQPLGMTSAGFGGLGTVGLIDQPWPHGNDGQPMPMNGPSVDNPEVIGPAGSVHCTMTDWSKFLVDQLRGGSGRKALLPDEIYQAMQPPPSPSGADVYGYGWGVCTRDWAGGKALNHAGSNTMNFCVAWLAPNRKFGVLVCSNQGGDTVFKACDEAAYAMIQRYLAGLQTSPAP